MSKIEQVVQTIKVCFTSEDDDGQQFNMVDVCASLVTAYVKRTAVIKEVGDKIGREIGELGMELKNIATALQYRK